MGNIESRIKPISRDGDPEVGAFLDRKAQEPGYRPATDTYAQAKLIEAKASGYNPEILPDETLEAVSTQMNEASRMLNLVSEELAVLYQQREQLQKKGVFGKLWHSITGTEKKMHAQIEQLETEMRRLEQIAIPETISDEARNVLVNIQRRNEQPITIIQPDRARTRGLLIKYAPVAVALFLICMPRPEQASSNGSGLGFANGAEAATVLDEVNEAKETSATGSATAPEGPPQAEATPISDSKAPITHRHIPDKEKASGIAIDLHDPAFQDPTMKAIGEYLHDYGKDYQGFLTTPEDSLQFAEQVRKKLKANDPDYFSIGRAASSAAVNRGIGAN